MSISRREFMALGAAAIAGSTLPAMAADNPPDAADVCVYGGTAGGVMAAVAAAREGCRVVIVEPSRWLGGMTGGGLSHIDRGRPEAVAGTTRNILKNGVDDPTYRRTFADLVKEHSVTVIYDHRLGSVNPDGATIKSLTLDHAPPDRFGCPAAQAKTAAARTVSAGVFIDCSYEGDLMAKAGVSYTFGRESTEEYGESLAGVRPNLAVYDIDPYVKPGDPASGLVPLLQDRKMGPLGSADRLIMGYLFRWKFAFDGRGMPIEPPDDYDPRTYELYRRGFRGKVPMDKGRRMRKLGVYEPEGGNVYQGGAGNLSRCLWAATVFGCNAEYPDGDWPTRSRIWKFHQDFLRGITHFLRTDPAAPTGLKNQALTVGFRPGIFDETAGWPHQLYVREARRMKSSYVLTQKDLEGKTDPDDPVGLASYSYDLINGTYTATDKNRDRVILVDAAAKLGDFSSSAPGVVNTFKAEPLADALGMGQSLLVTSAAPGGPKLLLRISLYNDYGFVALAAGLENTTDKIIQLKEFSPLNGGVAFKGFDTQSRYSALDGHGGGVKTFVTLGLVTSQRTEGDTDKIDPAMVSRVGLRWYKNRVVVNYDMDGKNPFHTVPDNRDGQRSMLTMAYVYDFWNDCLAGKVSGGKRFEQTLRPGEARMRPWRPLRRNPRSR